MTERERIAEFWRWWARRADEIATTIEAGNGRELAGELSEQVDRIDPGLQWEFAAGDSSRHVLCVTAAGVAELRPVAERWARAAPPGDATWAFRPARRADPIILGHRLDLDGRSIDLGETTVAIAVDEERREIDVQVSNPAYKKLPEESRARVTFLILDWALGEDGVEQWLGRIESPKKPPRGSAPIGALTEAVRELASKEVEWALMHAEDERGVTFVMARRPLKWIEFPLLDHHVEVVLPYEPRTRDDSGLPDPETLDHLQDMEQELDALAGDELVVAARETHRGRRTSHLYADGEDEAAIERIRAWAAGMPGATVSVSPDPGWRRVRPFA